MKKVIVVSLAVLIPFIILTIGFNTQELFGGLNNEGFITGYQFMYNILLLILGIATPIFIIMYVVKKILLDKWII